MSPRFAPLYGLVLAGGRSSRMGVDKGSLVYPGGDGLDQRRRCLALLANFCEQAFVSCRPDQAEALRRGDLPLILDAVKTSEPEGPAAGLLAAHREFPGAAWLVLACDFPWADADSLARLVSAREPGADAVHFLNEAEISEPLFALWEPRALAELAMRAAAGDSSPRRALEARARVSLRPRSPLILRNVNSPRD